MRAVVSRLFVVAVLAGVCASAFAADETAYPIKLHRTAKTGDAYTMRMTLEETGTMVASKPNNPSQSQDQSIKGDLAGRVDVASVNAAGEEKTFSITVTKFTAGPAGAEAVAAGKVIEVARTEQDVTFKLRDGGALSEEVKQVLGEMYSPLTTSDVVDDDISGSKTPRKVGESWPVNADAMVKQAASDKVAIEPKNVTGQTTLKGVETVNGIKALRVVSTVSMTNIKADAPPGLVVDASEMKMEISGLLPVDGALPPLETEMVRDAHAVLRDPAQMVTMETKTHVRQKQTVTPITK